MSKKIDEKLEYLYDRVTNLESKIILAAGKGDLEETSRNLRTIKKWLLTPFTLIPFIGIIVYMYINNIKEPRFYLETSPDLPKFIAFFMVFSSTSFYIYIFLNVLMKGC